ncbi:universal stress protein [Donghicola mangrovi]|uniref:Universal stress protein n=1 Tax=Donghicola mangrovi TaxID=2729614 RepID=A0A850QDF7_9RHOB|nr:universal stress protein [Donghicola mangrovi]NVO23901.1 universal stress protein [Donghicola mangrovi]
MTNPNILALIDGSAYSESLCHYTGWIAARTGATVELTHVLGRREGGASQDLSGSIRLGARTALLEELAALDAQRNKLAQATGRAILEDGKAIVEQHGDIAVTTRLRNGDLMDTVTEREGLASMLAIGKRGEAADFAKLHLGSNLERIVRATSQPVFVANRAYKEPQKVLIAYDGGASSMKAVDLVARNPLFAGLDCTIVTVGHQTDELAEDLNRAAMTLQSGGHQAETHIIQGSPDQVLGDLTDRAGYDLLVMGAYGHSRIRSLIIGSTTTEMIRSCKVPVVLVK